MTDAVAIALITGGTTVLSGLVTATFAYRSLRQGQANGAKADQIVSATDGHATKLTEQIQAARTESAAATAQVVDVLANALNQNTGSKGDRAGDAK